MGGALGMRSLSAVWSLSEMAEACSGGGSGFFSSCAGSTRRTEVTFSPGLSKGCFDGVISMRRGIPAKKAMCRTTDAIRQYLSILS